MKMDGFLIDLGLTALRFARALPVEAAVWEMAFRLGCAALAGALIGWERDRADKPVDARTMMLVSLGAAAFTLLGERVMVHSVAAGADSIIRLDPTRVLAYVISGVGFLGAGAILHSKRTVSGLTTASSVWCTAAVGSACGLGEYTVALLAFLIVFFTMWGSWLIKAKPEQTKNGNGKGKQNGKGRAPESADDGPVELSNPTG